jgi:hypothetical protein
METLLYATCQKLGITYVTICHRPALRVWHTHNLELLGDGKGGYSFAPLEHTPAEEQTIAEHARNQNRSISQPHTAGDSSSCVSIIRFFWGHANNRCCKVFVFLCARAVTNGGGGGGCLPLLLS